MNHFHYYLCRQLKGDGMEITMKKIMAAIFMGMMIFSFAACGNSNEAESETKKETISEAVAKEETVSKKSENEESAENKTIHIGYAAAGMSSEFNMMIYDGLTELAEKEGVILDTLSCEGDVAKQIEQIDNFITKGVDKIIIFPADPGSCTDALVRARESGIEVITADVNVGKEAYDMAYNYSEEELGRACAKAAAAWIDKTFPDAEPGSVKCAIIGAGFSEQSLERGEWQATVTEYTDKANLVEVYNVGLENFAALSEQYTQVILQNYPDIACIISFTDTLALIADEIIMQTDLDTSKIGQFTVDLSKNGYDAIVASADDQSTIRGTCGFPDVVEYLMNMALGKIEVDENGEYHIEPVTITEDNVKDYSYLYY